MKKQRFRHLTKVTELIIVPEENHNLDHLVRYSKPRPEVAMGLEPRWLCCRQPQIYPPSPPHPPQVSRWLQPLLLHFLTKSYGYEKNDFLSFWKTRERWVLYQWRYIIPGSSLHREVRLASGSVMGRAPVVSKGLESPLLRINPKPRGHNLWQQKYTSTSYTLFGKLFTDRKQGLNTTFYLLDQF